MPDTLPQSISTFGGDIDHVIRFIWWFCVVWLVAAEGFVLYALVRFRRRDGVRAAWLPADTMRANAWVLVPAALVLVCDVFIEKESAEAWAKVKLDLPPADVLVRITGRQFAWTFTYAGEDGLLGTSDDFESPGELHVPVGRVVRFQLEAADVVHSFWVPSMRLKQDAVPGRSIPGWFSATTEGTYTIACAELCGAAHSYMKSSLVVDSPEKYRDWTVKKSGPHFAMETPR